PALGVTDRGYTEAQATVPPGATLLLFTDGLVERRAEALDVGLERLGVAASAVRTEPAGVLADRVVAQLTGEVHADDVALLVARRDVAVPPLEVALPATPDNLGLARAEVREWLAAARVGADAVQDVVLASGEALANAVEHGSPGDGSTRMHLQLRLEPDRGVRVVVADEGHWQPPAADPGLRGQGIRFMRAVMEDVEIDRWAGGTSIRMVRRPRAPREPARALEPAATEGTASVAIDAERPGHPVAVVTGDVDAPGAGAVGERIRGACAADAHLRLDLSRIGYLDSSGVRLLAELAARQAAGGGDLTVRAPVGGAAHRILALTGLADATGLILEE
ncbi:MAG TPA: ATP-binding protein, partial [Miltoncostaea sp.]|nr:ATP-binding protein [Miltoncostaea sp.]